MSLAALAAVVVPAAYAHYTYVYHGNDLASIGSDDHTASACDRETDGNAVYAELILSNGNRERVWDYYDDVCSSRSFDHRIRHFRLCEQRDGDDSCTAWKDA